MIPRLTSIYVISIVVSITLAILFFNEKNSSQTLTEKISLLKNEIQQRDSKISSLQLRIAQLEDNLSLTESAQLNSLTEQTKTEQIRKGAAFETADPSKTSPLATFENNNQNVSTTETAAFIARVESVIALSNQQREGLRERYNKFPDLSEEAILEEVLGDATYQKYQEQQQTFLRQLNEERTEQEIFKISRKLSLSPEVENQVAEVIRSGRSIFFPIEQIANQTRKSPMERMREWMQKEEQRTEYNNTNLRAILNDQQYNAYLQIQAESMSRRSHQSFLQALASPTPTP